MYSGLIGTFGVLVRRVRQWQREEGAIRAFLNLVGLITQVLLTPLYCMTRGRRTFTFRGKPYPYFCHWYNTTFDNERALEVPVALELMKARPGKRILEVGNVLAHYTDIPHDVLDKYEKGSNVIHEDVVSFQPQVPYDLIVSISTMEHVGFDETPQEPEKFLRGVENLKRCLAPGGELMVTLPIGYNPHILPMMKGENVFQEHYYLQRVSPDNRWEVCTQEQAFARQFDEPYSFGNAIIIAFLKK